MAKTVAPPIGSVGTGTLDIEFDATQLMDLFCHYSDGACPLGTRVLAFLKHPQQQRKIALLVESDQWSDPEIAESDLLDKSQLGGLAPLEIRYEGKRVLSWGDKHAPVTWKDSDNFSA